MPDGAGTRLQMEVQLRPLTLAARLLSPLMYLMSKVMAKTCARDLRDLAAAAEGDTAHELGRVRGAAPPGD